MGRGRRQSTQEKVRKLGALGVTPSADGGSCGWAVGRGQLAAGAVGLEDTGVFE